MIQHFASKHFGADHFIAITHASAIAPEIFLLETVGLTESIGIILGANEALPESLSTAESILNLLHARATAVETVPVSDAISALASFLHQTGETVPFQEGMHARAFFFVPQSEDVPLADSLNSLRASIIVVQEGQVQVVESVGALAAFLSQQEETVTVSDSQSASAGFSGDVEEAVDVDDSTSGQSAGIPTVEETVQWQELQATLAVMATALTESVPEAAELAFQLTKVVRLRDEVLRISEMLLTKAAHPVRLVDDVDLAESIAQHRFFLSEVVTLSGQMFHLMMHVPSVSELVTFGESLSARVPSFILLNASVPITESTSITLSLEEHLNEGTQVAASLSVVTGGYFQEILGEAVPLTAAVSTRLRNYVGLGEIAAISEKLHVQARRFYLEGPDVTIAVDSKLLKKN